MNGDIGYLAYATEDDDMMLALRPHGFQLRENKYWAFFSMVLVSALPKDRLVERPPRTYRTASSYMALA